MLRFDTFELDIDRAELRTAGGEAIKLRPKTFALLQFFATNANRLLSKQELMSAIWPNVHVGEDSLFQAIREIRTALGDKDRQLVKSVSGRGYLFEADVASTTAASRSPQSAASDEASQSSPPAPPARGGAWYWLQMTRRPALAVSLMLCFAVGVAFAAPMLVRRLYVPELQTIAVMPFEARTSDTAAAATMAANITDKLTDGLSKIGNVRVLAPQAEPRGANTTSALPANADFIVRGELQRNRDKWEVQARLIDATTGQVQWSGGYSVPAEAIDERLQQSRLTAGIGNMLALRINALTHARLSSPESKIVVEQAAAFLNQTNRERFAVAQDLLEKAHAEKPGDVDIAAALSQHLMRGVATVWYPVSENDAIEQRAKALLDKAVKQEPITSRSCKLIAVCCRRSTNSPKPWWPARTRCASIRGTAWSCSRSAWRNSASAVSKMR